MTGLCGWAFVSVKAALVCWIRDCGLDCNRIELDEIWGFIGKKVRHVREDDDPTFGDVWTYCAIDAETKLVPCYKVASKRTASNTVEFIADLESRMNNRIQISSDAMNAYAVAIEFVYGRDVDYAQIFPNMNTTRMNLRSPSLLAYARLVDIPVETLMDDKFDLPPEVRRPRIVDKCLRSL